MQVGWSVLSSSTLRVVTELGKSDTNSEKRKKKKLSFTKNKRKKAKVPLKARLESCKGIWGVSFAFPFWLDNEKRKNKMC